jgi:hypothetical protein
MANRILHGCVDIRGVLNWGNNDLKKLFKAKDGKEFSAEEIRNFLYDKLGEGHEVLPIGEPCEGFDIKTGCPGHPALK